MPQLTYFKLFSYSRHPVCLFSVFIVFFMGYFWLDEPIARFFHEQHWDTMAWLFFVAKFGKSWLYLGLFLVLAFFFRYVKREKLWAVRFSYLSVSFIVTESICLIMKMLLGRARPDAWFEMGRYGFYGLQKNPLFWSLPSGHTTTWMTLFIGLAVLFPRYSVVCVFSGLLLSSLRILSTSHYLSDVIFTAWLTVFEMGFLTYWLRRRTYFS